MLSASGRKQTCECQTARPRVLKSAIDAEQPFDGMLQSASPPNQELVQL